MAARKSTKRATRKRRGATKKQQPKGIPYFAISAAVILLGLLGYFIFAGEKPKINKAIKQPPKQEETLPEKPEPKWEYEKILKNKEVKVEIPEKTKPKHPYQMQCGSFRKQKDAESLKAKIAFQGLTSEVRKTGNWYRVILGPYERKRLAERERHKLQRAKINGCQIWYWR